MKKLVLCGVSLALMATMAAAAQGNASRSVSARLIGPAAATQSNVLPPPPTLSPVPDPAYTPSNQTTVNYQPMPSQSYPVVTQPSYPVVVQPLQLFPDVRYRATRNIAPCAVATIVQVPDPCNKDKCCRTCVNVQICAPPCDPQCVRVTRDGNSTRYEYGNYAVTVRVAGDHIVVRYAD